MLISCTCTERVSRVDHLANANIPFVILKLLGFAFCVRLTGKYASLVLEPYVPCKIDTTNLHACAGLFMCVQKIFEELWKIHVSLPHASLKFKLSSTVQILNIIFSKMTVQAVIQAVIQVW